jgi:hypothetical protein
MFVLDIINYVYTDTLMKCIITLSDISRESSYFTSSFNSVPYIVSPQLSQSYLNPKIIYLFAVLPVTLNKVG